MKKLVLDCRFWGPSHTGLGRYTQSLVTALYQLKPKFDVYLIINPRVKRQLSKKLPRFKLIPAKSRPYSLAEQFEIPRLLNQLKPDLVHFLHFNVPLLTTQPFIVTIHDLIKHHSSGKATTTQTFLVYPLKRLGYYLTMLKAVNQSQAVLTPSNWVKKDILKFYPNINSKKITVTPEAADPAFFKPVNSKFKPPKYPYLIYAGNAYPHKNLIQLIKVIKEIPLKLVIVTGRDIFYQRLRKDIRHLQAQSSIKIKDFTQDTELQVLYHHSLAFITPSLLEGFGLPGLEAMASKTLVLSSNQGPLPEVYAQAAFYFNPQDPSNMTRVIKKLLKLSPQQRQAKIKRAFKHAQTYSWQTTAEKTLKAYETCLSLRSS